MQGKLKELQSKLAGEESEKVGLLRKVTEAEKKLQDRDELEKVYAILTPNSNSHKNVKYLLFSLKKTCSRLHRR